MCPGISLHNVVGLPAHGMEGLNQKCLFKIPVFGNVRVYVFI